jgi:hypothetical protein
MRNVVVFNAALLLLAGWMALPAAAQTPAAPGQTIPRLPDGKPDFSGLYNIPYTPNMAQGGKEQDVPYTDRGRQAFLNHDSKDDPTSNCWFPGVPRIMQSPYPARLVQTDEYLLILFEYMTMHRIIPLDGRAHPANMEPSFMGDSVGHWEGDTLIVDTINLKDAPWTWLDTAGHQHSDALHVIEKFWRLPGSTKVEYEFTVDDPKMYTKPWANSRPLTPLKPTAGLPDLLEYNCEENNRDLQHLRSNKPALQP